MNTANKGQFSYKGRIYHYEVKYAVNEYLETKVTFFDDTYSRVICSWIEPATVELIIEWFKEYLDEIS